MTMRSHQQTGVFLPGDKIGGSAGPKTVVASTFYDSEMQTQTVILLHTTSPYFSVRIVNADTGKTLQRSKRVLNIGEAVTLYENWGGDVL